MEIAMSLETVTDVFGNAVHLRRGTPLATGQETVSVIGEKGEAWSQVFIYDPVSQVMDSDAEKLQVIVTHYPSKTNFALSALIGFSNIVLGVIDGVAGIIKAILGSFVGVGVAGIAFVLMLILLSLMVSFYAFVFAVPVFALSYGLRSYKNGLLKAEANKIQQAALGLFQQNAQLILPQDEVLQVSAE